MEGNKKEQKEFAKEIGLFEAKVVAINPDREELTKLLGTEPEKDPEYVSRKKLKNAEGTETGEEVDAVRISVWTEDIKTKRLRNISFYIEDRPRTNKEGTKMQYVNCVGTTSWALIEDGDASLANWFTHFLSKDKTVIGDKAFRPALVGEEELMNFVKTWTMYDLFDVNTSILLDTRKLLRGNVTELESEIGGDMVQTIVAMATVRIVEKVINEETAEKEKTIYQSVYSKEFLPGYTMKYFRGVSFNNERIAQIRAKSKLANYERFIVNIADPEYGCKTPIFLGEIKPFEEEEHLATSGAVMAEDDATY